MQIAFVKHVARAIENRAPLNKPRAGKNRARIKKRLQNKVRNRFLSN
jgi:hypothetical protein